MISYKAAKQACFRLAKAFNQPLAKVQETFAQAIGHRDWNTLAAAENKPHEEYHVLHFGEDTHLVILKGDKEITEIAHTRDYHQLFLGITCQKHAINIQKLETLAEDWTFVDCWEFIRKNGFKQFLETYKVGSEKPAPQAVPQMIAEHFPKGKCPDCGEPIPANAQWEEHCANCGHVWAKKPCGERVLIETPQQKLARLETEFAAAGGRGVELADEIDRLREELEAPAEPNVIRFKTVLLIPKVWKTLLDIEDFDALPEALHKSYSAPKKARDEHGNIRNDWPHPLRDDAREVSFQEDGYEVIVTLLSGNNNYWTTAKVVSAGKTFEADEAGFDIHDEDELASGEFRFQWKQKLV